MFIDKFNVLDVTDFNVSADVRDYVNPSCEQEVIKIIVSIETQEEIAKAAGLDTCELNDMIFKTTNVYDKSGKPTDTYFSLGFNYSKNGKSIYKTFELSPKDAEFIYDKIKPLYEDVRKRRERESEKNHDIERV